MDSGNSGSLQSSSGGDDDFDSRGGGGGVDSSPLSALLRPTPSPSSAAGAFSLHGSLYGLQDFTSAPPQQQQQHQQQAPWSSAQFMAGAGSSSQRVAPTDAGMGASAHQAPDPSAAAAAPAPPRGSRKRARASRRAPTTVLTTDTSNFRAMVQEFTGIPNPPFAAGAGVPGAASFNSRFDHIFSSSSALRSAADSASSLPPYLLRPFAQKLQTAPAPSPFAPFTSPSSSTPPSSNVGGPNANVNATTAATTANQRADDFQLPSSALLRMQQDQSSSYLSFQNLLGSTQPTSQQHMFGGLSHGAPRGLHEQSPSQLLSGAGTGLTHGGGMMVSEGMRMHQHQQRNDVHQGGDELSGVVRAGASGSGSCKLNYTSSHAGGSSSSAAASTDAPPDGGGASRPGRGEGLDPWLCTSE